MTAFRFIAVYLELSLLSLLTYFSFVQHAAHPKVLCAGFRCSISSPHTDN